MFLKQKFISPMSGTIRNLEDMEDEVFSSKSMGDGFMIDYDGEYVVSPFDATVEAVFPTGHALGLKAKDGTEIIIHIGIDTFELGLDYFDLKVSQGDQVKQGDILVKIKSADIINHNLSPQTAIVFTSGQKVTIKKPDKHVEVNEKNIIKYK